MMSSGRRETALIFCTSVMKNLYIPSAEHYDPDRIYAFVSNRDDPLSKIERRVYRDSRDEIECGNITECSMDTSDYEKVLSTIIDIKKDLRNRFGDDLDIFINISSGTPEFAAAGMFASMLPKPATAFRVDTECSLSETELSQIIETIGKSVTVSDPHRVSVLQNEGPDDEMVEFLRVVKGILDTTRFPRYHTIIEELKKHGVWSYDPEKKSHGGRTTLKQKEERYLTRHYLTAALENGWLERPNANTMRITPKGLSYLSVFSESAKCCAEERYCNEEDIQYDYCRSVLSSSWKPAPAEDNVVSFSKDGKNYCFRISEEQHK